jgi:hypothetical protein
MTAEPQVGTWPNKLCHESSSGNKLSPNEFIHIKAKAAKILGESLPLLSAIIK